MKMQMQLLGNPVAVGSSWDDEPAASLGSWRFVEFGPPNVLDAADDFGWYILMMFKNSCFLMCFFYYLFMQHQSSIVPVILTSVKTAKFSEPG